MVRFLDQYRAARREARRSGDRVAVMPLTETVEALGTRCWTRVLTDVPVERIVGSAGRVGDFDRRMRPLGKHLRQRWDRVAAALGTSVSLPPVRLVQLGELYFVVDGHHRVSVARAAGMAAVEAEIRRTCTIAYACHCLSVLDLPAKAAERRFLERYPVPDDVRPWLWLDNPADWTRLEEAASAWVLGESGDRTPSVLDMETRVEEWWRSEVVPTAYRCHSNNQTSLDDYLCALSERDTNGCCIA